MSMGSEPVGAIAIAAQHQAESIKKPPGKRTATAIADTRALARCSSRTTIAEG